MGWERSVSSTTHCDFQLFILWENIWSSDVFFFQDQTKQIVMRALCAMDEGKYSEAVKALKVLEKALPTTVFWWDFVLLDCQEQGALNIFAKCDLIFNFPEKSPFVELSNNNFLELLRIFQQCQVQVRKVFPPSP